MTNRVLSEIIKDQHPLALRPKESVRRACQLMRERGAGSVLVLDGQDRLVGIFTGRDAVRVLALSRRPAGAHLERAMTSRPVTVSVDSRAIDALRTMSAGGFRHVPVLDGERVWGVVSRGDLKGMELESFSRANSGPRGAADRSVGEIVSGQQPLVLAADTSVRLACRAMWRRKCGSVLVADAAGRLVGIFTGRDAVRALAEHDEPAQARLSDVMTAQPVSMSPERRSIDALHAMSDGGFRHVPVVTADGRILGVVSRSDLTGSELDRLEEEEHLYACLR